MMKKILFFIGLLALTVPAGQASAKAVKLGRSAEVSTRATGAISAVSAKATISKSCCAHCVSCDTTSGICSACAGGYKLVDNKCEYIPTPVDQDMECVRNCGDGFYYDRPGAKNGGKELVCTKYPKPCGYGCTTGWDIKYLVNGTNYTCQTAVQSSDESDPMSDAACVKYCGQGFGEARSGAKNGGKEIVCTRYPKSCGYGCTTGWDIDYLVNGTNYTCQTAIQTGDDSSDMSDAACVKHCGQGFGEARSGLKNGGKEIVCTKYPLSCGYGCTVGWDIDYLVKGTNYTCQTAIQTGKNADCVRLCGSGFYYDRPGEKNNGQELVCTKYPKSCGYDCTTGWDIQYLVQGTDYTCQTAIQK